MAESINPYESPREVVVEAELAPGHFGDTIVAYCHVQRDDVLAWGEHFARHSPVIRAGIRRAQVATGIMFAFVLLLGLLPFGNWRLSLFFFAFSVAGLVSTLFYLPGAHRRAVVRNTLKLNEENRTQNVLGDVRFVVTPRAIRRENRFYSCTFTWHAIDHLDRTDDHLFIYLTTSSAMVLPLRDFADEQHREAFIAAAERYLEQSHHEEPPPPDWLKA